MSKISNEKSITKQRTVTEHRTKSISNLINTIINKNEETAKRCFNLTYSTIGRLNAFTKHYKFGEG
jgi:hypothetical protein